MFTDPTRRWPRSRSVALVKMRISAIWIAALCVMVSFCGCGQPPPPPPRPPSPNPLVVEFWIAASPWDVDPVHPDPNERFEWHPIKDGPRFITAHARSREEEAQWLDDPTGLRSRNLVVRRTDSGGYELLMLVAEGAMMRRDPDRPWGVVGTSFLTGWQSEPMVGFTLDAEGARRIWRLSERADFPRERPIAILLNGEIVGASRFRPTREGRVRLWVHLTEPEVRDYRQRLE